jgi:colicin import membrane protein
MASGQTQRELTMATGNTTPATARNTCKHPGCGQPAAPATGPGRPPEYCEGRGQTEVTAWRERRRLAAAEAGTTSPADTDSPVTMAKVTGAELLRALRTEADRVSGIADRLRQAVETVTDPTAAEAEVEAIRAAAEQRAAAAEADRDQALAQAAQAEQAARRRREHERAHGEQISIVTVEAADRSAAVAMPWPPSPKR